MLFRSVFIAVTVPTALAAALDFLNTLPEGGKAFLHAGTLLAPAREYLPFFTYGMGWVLPACVGLVVGLALHFGKKQP